MKTYSITNNAAETIEFRANENTYALVHRFGDTTKTIILNQREVLNLFEAIKSEVLKGIGFAGARGEIDPNRS